MIFQSLFLSALLFCISGQVAISQRKSFWLEEKIVAHVDPKIFGYLFELHYNLTGPVSSIPTRRGQGIPAVYSRTLTGDSYPKFPNLNTYLALRLETSDSNLIREILKGDAIIADYDGNGNLVKATRIQNQGVLDSIYAYSGKLGAVFSDSSVTLNLWAPTSKKVELIVYDGPETSSNKVYQMTFNSNNGVWSYTGSSSDLIYKYYNYKVQVFVSTLQFVDNIVTDPYSVSLSRDSQRSQIVDIFNDKQFKPEGWDTLVKPTLDSFMDIVIYELHIRDFSITDLTVNSSDRGLYDAFNYNGLNGNPISNGMKHLMDLQKSGLTHIHLLPSYDFGSVPEDINSRSDPDRGYLSRLPSDSTEQQRTIGETRFVDSYNWGYDPFHFGPPEGSYARREDQHGANRILSYRKMIKSLSDAGLRVVQDVVYNHVFQFGQESRAVLDRIVPEFYHRYDNNGVIQQISCCPDLATELYMVERLMIDHLVHWARVYKIDSFRFDLMGFHTIENMKNIKSALATLKPETDGVDGSKIYIYGEGWDFGSAKAKGFDIASQFGVAGLGIGTFNDKIRDSIHGGSREDPLEIRTQGFINGLSYDWNGYSYNGRYQGDLRYRTDVIRIGLAGNLQNYQFIDQNGNTETGASYGVGYALSPRECINYAESHDDQTLFDLNVFKAPLARTTKERSRMQNLAISIVALSQGIPFFHAGIDMLLSKSLDRNSFDSWDWFNLLDFTYQKNNYAVGMPPEWNNERRYDIIKPLLANKSLLPNQVDIISVKEHIKEAIAIRKSSKMFRLETESDIKSRVKFFNTGPQQTDALILMHILDDVNGLPQVDSKYKRILVAFNADKNDKRYTIGELKGNNYYLHPIFSSSYDSIVRTSSFSQSTGEVFIPSKTCAVFVLNR